MGARFSSDRASGGSRRSAIAPFIVMDVLRAANDRAAAGGRVVHLEVGQPSSPAPELVRQAAAQALTADRIGYTDALGLEGLRRRIARHYQDYYHIELDWRRVAVTGGSSGGFVLAFLAAFDAGDRVVVSVPGYPAYRNILSALDVDVVSLELDATTHFQPTPAVLDDLVRRSGRIHGLVVASPANPTGSMIGPERLGLLAAWCADQGTRLICDEIYHRITYATRAETALRFGNDAIIVNSFSKYYAMTGWRVGWLILPERLQRTVECLAQNLYISPPTLSQHGALRAFDCSHILDGHVAGYAANREILLDALPRAGFGRIAPADGAFYLYAEVAAEDPDSDSLCRLLLEETEVAITPGIDFDPGRGHRFIRFSYAGESAEVKEAAARLIDWRERRSRCQA